MRQQMAILKEKLQEQNIVNDRLIRQSMKKNVVSINRRYLIVSILCVLMIPYGYWAFVALSHFSIAFWLGTCLFMLVNAAMHPKAEDAFIIDPELLVEKEYEFDKPTTPATRIEQASILNYLIGIAGIIYIIRHFIAAGSFANGLDLNTVNFIFLIGAVVLLILSFLFSRHSGVPSAIKVISVPLTMPRDSTPSKLLAFTRRSSNSIQIEHLNSFAF